MERIQSTGLYWTCQAVGWTAFTAYVLTAYVASVGLPHVQAADVVSILLFDAVLCPLIAHGLRLWMKAHGWLTLPLRRLAPRLILAVLLISAGLTGLVLVVTASYRGGQTMPAWAIAGPLLGFASGMAGWLVIYFRVLARRRLAAFERQALELSLVARDAQLRALRSQLNPHFLFNALNSLRGLIVEDPARAASMVTGFAGLMRYSLGSDRRETVTLAEEIEAVDDYLGLERVRFEERLRVERALTPEALRALIPPMIVQGLVENAVKHGIAALPAGGLVRIEATVADRQLRIQVSNTGSLAARAGTTGVGLGNARERLRLLYGPAASLTLDGHDGRTVVACLIVPCAGVTA